MSTGQKEYERDTARRKTYAPGKPRPTWDQLCDLARSTWDQIPETHARDTAAKIRKYRQDARSTSITPSVRAWILISIMRAADRYRPLDGPRHHRAWFSLQLWAARQLRDTDTREHRRIVGDGRIEHVNPEYQTDFYCGSPDA
jgi:hypothetical protein